MCAKAQTGWGFSITDIGIVGQFLMRLDFYKKSFFGFILGILPFIISGPTQTLGIFVWIIKHLFEGFGGTGLASDAYRVVLFIPGLIFLSFFVKIVLDYVDSHNTYQK